MQDAFFAGIRRQVEARRDVQREIAEVDYVPKGLRIPNRELRWDETWRKRARRVAAGADRDYADDGIDVIPTPAYVLALTGEEVEAGRPAPCPLPDHEDDTASFYAYDGDRGWYCFGCNRGGNIYNLAGAMWGIDTRGARFPEVCQRLREVFA